MGAEKSGFRVGKYHASRQAHCVRTNQRCEMEDAEEQHATEEEERNSQIEKKSRLRAEVKR